MKRRSSVLDVMLKSSAEVLHFASINCLWFSNSWPLSHKLAALSVVSHVRVSKNKRGKVKLHCCRFLPSSNLHMSLQFHFLHSSHACSIVPCVLLRARWLHRMKQIRRWFLKEENRLCAETSQRPQSGMRVHTTSNNFRVWSGTVWLS